MAKSLKSADPEQWISPNIAIEKPENIPIIEYDHVSTTCPISELHDQLIEQVLGPVAASQPSNSSNGHNDDIHEAFANLIMDMEYTSLPKQMPTMLKATQPYREKPSKDRSKRFMVGSLPFDIACDEHDVYCNQFI